MSDMRCATCYLLISACRCSQLERCAECNGVIVEGFCDCDDEDDDDCDCVFCREERGEEVDDCDDPDCDICN